MIIKVCGLREAENIRAISELGNVNMLGFNFCPDSPRFIRMISSRAGIIPDYSKERLQKARGFEPEVAADSTKRPKRVGVFVDDMPQNIVTRVYNYDLDYVQLSGSESAVMIDNLRRTLEPDIRPGIGIIKEIAINNPDDLKQCKEYEGLVDMFIFNIPSLAEDDAAWQGVKDYEGPTPFLLSGCIAPGCQQVLRHFNHPRFAGINLDEHFETEPGVKDIERLKDFLFSFFNAKY